jgi:hypothetical protein
VSLHDPDKMDVYLSHIRAGLTRTEACKAMGLPVNPTMKLIREDPVIFEQVREAEDEKFAPVLKTLFTAATELDPFGLPNMEAIREVMAYKRHIDTMDTKREEARQKALAQQAPSPVRVVLPSSQQMQELEDAIRRRAITKGDVLDVPSEEI